MAISHHSDLRIRLGLLTSPPGNSLPGEIQPGDVRHPGRVFDYYIQLMKTMEKARFDALFAADRLTSDTEPGTKPEPCTLFSAIAAVTEKYQASPNRVDKPSRTLHSGQPSPIFRPPVRRSCRLEYRDLSPGEKDFGDTPLPAHEDRYRQVRYCSKPDHLRMEQRSRPSSSKVSTQPNKTLRGAQSCYRTLEAKTTAAGHDQEHPGTTGSEHDHRRNGRRGTADRQRVVRRSVHPSLADSTSKSARQAGSRSPGSKNPTPTTISPCLAKAQVTSKHLSNTSSRSSRSVACSAPTTNQTRSVAISACHQAPHKSPYLNTKSPPLRFNPR